MAFLHQTSDSEAFQAIANAVQSRRLDWNISQADLASEAGVGRGAVQRIENGQNITTEALIRILRELGLLEDTLSVLKAHTDVVSPIAEAKRLGKQRKRAGRPRASSESQEEPEVEWQWGDEL